MCPLVLEANESSEGSCPYNAWAQQSLEPRQPSMVVTHQTDSFFMMHLTM